MSKNSIIIKTNFFTGFIPKFILIIGFVLSSFFTITEGQETTNTIKADSLKLKLFLDCHDCDFTYFRLNMPYVDFVRDPKTSDVHLLVTEQRTASNGREYGFNFIGNGNYSDLNYKLLSITPQSDTELETLERLLKTTRTGLMPFLSRTPEINNLEIDYKLDSIGAREDQSIYDSWNYWVFRLDFGSDIDIEESQNEISAMGSISIERITEQFKFRSDFSYFNNTEKFQDDTEEIISKRKEIDSDLEFVYSLGPHWSVGLFSEIKSSTYRNFSFFNRVGPAIEYNIFPWDRSDRKVFALSYFIQSNYFNYIEPTIYNETSELRASESLRLLLILRQPWGNVTTALEGSHYFHDFSKNRLGLESRVSVNITKGLSVFFELDAGLIHDQIYLPAGEVSIEELLLRQQQLETNYQFSGEFGISFTFGSIYNNIVNQRL